MIDWLAARGELAAGVARELSEPLDRVHASLARVVERLDRHVAGARGPEPLPWQAVSEVRERVAGMYLEVGRVRRLAATLAMLAAPAERRAADVNEIVERALVVARHRFAGDADALLDLASGSRVVVDPARLIQAVALLIAHAADVAEAGAVTIRTSASATEVTISVAAPSVDLSSPPFVDAVRAAVVAEGGRLELAPSGFTATLALPRLDALR
jgi:signal transduction histidine kinase